MLLSKWKYPCSLIDNFVLHMFIGGCGPHSDDFVFAADNRMVNYCNNILVQLDLGCTIRLEFDLAYCYVIV